MGEFHLDGLLALSRSGVQHTFLQTSSWVSAKSDKIDLQERTARNRGGCGVSCARYIYHPALSSMLD